MSNFEITPELREQFVANMTKAASGAEELSKLFRGLSELAGNGADFQTIKKAMRNSVSVMEAAFGKIDSPPAEWMKAMEEDDNDELAGAGESAAHE